MSRRWSARTRAPSTCKGPACCSCSSIGAPEYVEDYNVYDDVDDVNSQPGVGAPEYVEDYNDDDVDDANSRPGQGDKFSWLAWLVLSWSRPGQSQQSGDQDSDHNMLEIRL